MEAQRSLASATVALETAAARAGTLEDALDNLQATYERFTAGYAYALRDPTYRIVLNFLAADLTNSRRYDLEDYNCTDYSADVKANAAQQGIRCGYVSSYFPDARGHAIVAFDTTDRGSVFFEAQTDDEVELRAGMRYHESVIPQPGNTYLSPPYDHIVVRYTIIW